MSDNAITLTGAKHLSTVQREFTEKFAFLGLRFFSTEEFEKSQRGEPARPMRSDVTIASVRTKQGKDVSLFGQTHTGNFEKAFLKEFGIQAQVSIRGKDGVQTYYTGENLDALTLSELNRRAEEAGHPKFEY